MVAAFSTGPVGLGDGPGYTNPTLALATCRADGTLLQPDKPLTGDLTPARARARTLTPNPNPNPNANRNPSPNSKPNPNRHPNQPSAG